MNCPHCCSKIELTCNICSGSYFDIRSSSKYSSYHGFSNHLRIQCHKCTREHHEKLSNQRSFLKLQTPDPSTPSDVLNGDVTLFVEGCSSDAIRAHRFILAEKSPVFRRMFESEMTEKNTGIISIDDASYATMQAVVRFCYTAEIDFTEDLRADEILRVAHKYEILPLQDQCAKELCKRISRENVIEMMKLSRDCEVKELGEALGEYIKGHYQEILPVIAEGLK